MGPSNGTSGVPIGTTTRGAVRPDHQNIHFTSKKEIGMSFINVIQFCTHYFQNLVTVRNTKQCENNPALTIQTIQILILKILVSDSSIKVMESCQNIRHVYKFLSSIFCIAFYEILIYKLKKTPLDTLSESSFASDNPNFQNKFQIRQLLKVSRIL